MGSHKDKWDPSYENEIHQFQESLECERDRSNFNTHLYLLMVANTAVGVIIGLLIALVLSNSPG